MTDLLRAALIAVLPLALPGAVPSSIVGALSKPTATAVATAGAAGAGIGGLTYSPRVKHVLIISEDGLRADAVSTLHLKWHDLLRKRGSFSAHALTIRDASTLPAHASMLSGVDSKVHGLTWNNWRPSKGYIKAPTIFDHAREAGLTTAFFTGKSKLRHIVPPGTVGVYARPGYYCRKVAEEAAEHLVGDRPALAFVHFSDPDEYGHSHGWTSPEYKRAARNSDRCLATVLAAIDGSKHRDDTLVIVTADHGGESRHHNGHDKQSRAIPWIARGPGVTAGASIDKPIDTVDTAATALAALGLPRLPKMTGTSRLFTR